MEKYQLIGICLEELQKSHITEKDTEIILRILTLMFVKNIAVFDEIEKLESDLLSPDQVFVEAV